MSTNMSARRTDVRKLEQLADDQSEDSQRSLVFETFGGFVHLLEGEPGIAVQTWIIEKHADSALALVHFLQYFLEGGHGGGGFVVECCIRKKFAERPLASPGLVEDLARIGQSE